MSIEEFFPRKVLRSAAFIYSSGSQDSCPIIPQTQHPIFGGKLLGATARVPVTPLVQVKPDQLLSPEPCSFHCARTSRARVRRSPQCSPQLIHFLVTANAKHAQCLLRSQC